MGVVGDMQLSEIKSLAETAGAIANTLRLAIMMALRDTGKQSFNELLDAFEVNPNSSKGRRTTPILGRSPFKRLRRKPEIASYIWL